MSTAAVARRTARAVVVGSGARRALRDAAGATGGGHVELAFGPGGYLCLGGHHVLLAPVRSPLGPLSILVAGLVRGDLVPGDPAAVEGGALVVGPLRIELAGARDAPAPHAGELSEGWRVALAAARDAVGPAPPALASGIAALAAGDVAGAVAQLAGRGDGLTPAGDDVLAGFAAWRWSCGRPVALPAQRCAPLGRDYLRCAERGELPEPAAAVLNAIRDADPRSAARRAACLADWGASSGAALLWGIAAGAAATAASHTASGPGAGSPGALTS